jgi:hypothetical protein
MKYIIDSQDLFLRFSPNNSGLPGNSLRVLKTFNIQTRPLFQRVSDVGIGP